MIPALLADSGRDLPKKLFDQRPELHLHVAVEEVRAHEADGAVDVVADAPGRDYAAFLRIGGADTADANAVAPVNIRHCQAGELDTRQVRDVGDLVRRLVRLELLEKT